MEQTKQGTKKSFREWILKNFNLTYTTYMSKPGTWRIEQYNKYSKGHNA
jgi:hypothetical protein